MWQYDRSVRFFVWKLGHVGDAVDYTGVSFPFPSLSMCAPRSAVSIFIVKVKMQTDAALQFGYVSFASSTFSLSSSYSASLLVCLVRFVGFIINEGFLFAVLRCFVFAASSGFIFLQCLFLFFSPSLFFFCPAFMQFLRISCALLNILTGVSASPAWHLQYLLSTVAQWTSFQATGQSRGSTGEEGSAALFVQF